MATRDFLSVQAVAAELGLAEPTVRTAIRSKRLPSQRVDGVVSVAREDVEAYRRRTQADGNVRRGRPRNVSVTKRDAMIGTDLTPDEVERAQLFRQLPEGMKKHVHLLLETLARIGPDAGYKVDFTVRLGKVEDGLLGVIQVAVGHDVEILSSEDDLRYLAEGFRRDAARRSSMAETLGTEKARAERERGEAAENS